MTTRRDFFKAAAASAIAISPRLGQAQAATGDWIGIAESLKPALHRRSANPVRLARAQRDPAGFQQWTMADAGAPGSVYDKPLGRGDSFIVDFGEHMVGYPRFSATCAEGVVDAPIRLKLTMAEVPAEAAEPFDPYPGMLSRSWLQDETINLDVLPARVTMPRRYAFRYIRFDVVDTSPSFKVQIREIGCEAVTSAGDSAPLPAAVPEPWRTMDAVSLRTLRDCMQTVFEDGPKRDRRLWLGDLRLQALTNYASFRNFDLVKRCLYLFAGLAYPDGLVPACVYERPAPSNGQVKIMDYAAFFGPVLLDYLEASGDQDTARRLWPVARRQLELTLRYVDSGGLFHDPGGWWIFIDWSPELDKSAPMHAVLVYALRRSAQLARRLEDRKQAAEYESLAAKMSQAARTRLREKPSGLFVSGDKRQVSWATQAWMVLAGAVDAQEGAALLRAVASRADAVRPATPYLYHHVVDAMLTCGMESEAKDLMQQYWGGMIRKGADTFWEVYDPNNDLLSPYKSHLVNSYCHAWSCTPAYFIRKRLRFQ